jgi:hypothetical protein
MQAQKETARLARRVDSLCRPRCALSFAPLHQNQRHFRPPLFVFTQHIENVGILFQV